MLKQWMVALLICGCALMAGCGKTQNSDFYILKASHTHKKMPKNSCVNIALGPLTLPQYLERPQIALLNLGNRVHFSEFHRWAEPLDDNIERVLGQDISDLLKVCKILEYPWEGNAEYSYQVTININRFVAVESGMVDLWAKWSLLSKKGKTLLSQSTKLTVKLPSGYNYNDIVAAMNQNLAGLSAQIAEAIKRLED